MAFSKVILNGTTLMDVTQDTVESSNLLSGIQATKNDGTTVTGSITSKTSSDVTVSGGTVTIPAGAYASSVTKSVAPGSATTPATTITANPSISVNSSGLITATASATKSVTPTVSAGYVSNGTAGTITVSGSNTSQLTTQAAQTIHPSTSDQTITSGKYLTGTQTVKGVLLTNLSAGNIKDGVVVKVGDSTDDDCVTSVTGTYSGGGGVTWTTLYNQTTYVYYGTPPYISISNFTHAFSAGETYRITWNNTEYICQPQVDTSGTTYDGYFIGNTHLVYSSDPDTGEPFLLYRSNSSTLVGVIDSSFMSQNVSLKIEVSSSSLITKNITANGTYNASDDSADGYSSVTVNVSGGSTPTADPSLPIKFIDYDGTILYSYSVSDFNALNAMPSNPTHAGLTSQGWNYTLAEAKAEASSVGACIIGQMYITQSGDTEIDVVFDKGRFSPILCMAVNGTVVVDWGDNSATSTVTGTSLDSLLETQHTFPGAGDYTIKIHVTSGGFTFSNSTNSGILRRNTTSTNNRVYLQCIKAVRLGSGITTIGSYAFYYSGVRYVTIPNTITAFGTYAFEYANNLRTVIIPKNNSLTEIKTYDFAYCSSLQMVSIPTNITSIGTYAFYSSASFNTIVLPSSITTIGNNMLQACYCIASAIIPPNVTSIGNASFRYLYGAGEYHVLPKSPPTAGTDLFTGIVSDCIIYVPRGYLATYQAAQNWSDFASYMREEPQ